MHDPELPMGATADIPLSLVGPLALLCVRGSPASSIRLAVCRVRNIHITGL